MVQKNNQNQQGGQGGGGCRRPDDCPVWPDTSELAKLRQQVVAMRSWLGSEFGYDNNTQGNTYRHMANMEKKSQQNHEALYGNGKEGLLTRVTVLENNNKNKAASLQVFISICSIFVAIVATVIALVTSQ